MIIRYLKIFIAAPFIFLLASPVQAQSTSLYLDTNKGNYVVGDKVVVDIYVDANDYVNAVRGEVKLPYQYLDLVKIDKSDSILSVWSQEPTVKANRLYFVGGVPSPGFKGQRGKILTLEFTAKSPGQVVIEFVSGSVHLNDGLGTNVLEVMRGVEFSILPQVDIIAKKEVAKPPLVDVDQSDSGDTADIVTTDIPTLTVTSLTHPDQSSWYNTNDAVLSWDLPPGFAVSYSLSQAIDDVPPTDMYSSDTTAQFDDLADGVWYFHIRATDKKRWGEITTYRLQIDTTPPNFIDIGIFSPNLVTSIPLLRFVARDDLSGVDFYQVRIDGGEWVKATTTEFLPPQLEPGSHLVVVQAVDKAGNISVKEKKIKIVSLSSPQITTITSPLPSDKYLEISGRADPEVMVKIEIGKTGGNKFGGVVRADKQGRFYYKHPTLLPAGDYYIRAQSFLPTGISSDWSEFVYFTVKPSLVVFLSNFGNYLKFSLPILIAVIILAILYLFYDKTRNKTKQEKVSDELSDLKQSIDFSFSTLKRDLLAEIDEMYKRKKAGQLSPEEEKKLHKLQVDLDVLEGYIKKELKDVEEAERINDKKYKSTSDKKNKGKK